MSGSKTAPVTDRQLMDRALWRILPLMVVLMIISTIDRTNIGFAKLGMMGSLGITEAAFGLGSSLFYLGYVAFEIPSAMAAYRYGARIWFARIMLTWSVTTLLLAIASSITGFYVLRFLLGAAEAGLYPAQIFFLTLWFPQRERARATGVLTLGSALGNGLSALICGVLLDLNGTFGLSGWQWIFAATGIAPLVATVLVLRYLPNRPSEAPFYDDAEKARVEAMLAEDPETSREQGHSLGAILNWRVVGFGLLYAILLGSLYGIVYWAPTVYSVFKLSGKMNGVLVAIPWAFDVVLLLLIPRRLKTYRATLLGLLVLGTLGVVSYGIGAVGGGVWIKLASLMVGIPAISLAISCFWTLPVRYFSGGRAAAAIGAISTIGNLGGVATLNAMPAVAKMGGSPATALLVPSFGMAVVIVASAAMLLRGRSTPGSTDKPN